MKKIFVFLAKLLKWLLLALLTLALAAWLFNSGLKQYRERALEGELRFENLPAQTLTSGEFEIAWLPQDGGQVRITRLGQPDKLLWVSLPGRAFVAAAQGREQVEEARGSFFVSDWLQSDCARQSLEQIETSLDGVTFAGHLTCGSRPAYRLTFQARTPQELHFRLEVEAPYNRAYLTYASNPEEHFFGFGEQFSYFDFKGCRLPIFIMEQGIGRGEQPITLGANLQARSGGDWHTSYAGVPHYITSQMRSLYLENYEYSVFDLRRSDRVQVSVFGNQMSGAILAGETPAALIAAYTAANGRMRPLPDWLLSGAIVGMQGGTEKVRQVWAQLEALDAPVAAFWLQDWVGQRTTSFGKQLWWNWELDRERYPDWEGLKQQLAAADVRILVYASPFLADVSEKPNARRNLFEEARRQGFLVRRPDGEPYLILNTSFSAGLVDLTNPEARRWLQAVLETEALGVGASGWMADFGEALPYDAQLADGRSGAEYHNQYPEDWAALNREVVEAQPNGAELVFFTRSGFRRSPSYTTLQWAGDQMVSWSYQDGIKSAVTGLLSSGLSGFSFNHSDIGGYTTITNPLMNYHRSQELLLRWMELNAFTVIYRTHEGNQPAQNAQFYDNAESLAHFVRMARVYQAWEFYRRQLVAEVPRTGLPVVRHLFIHYPNDPAVYALSYQQFLVGSELLVAPVLDAGRDQVQVYLPQGEWVLAWDGTTYQAGAGGLRVKVAAPLGQPAVFYPAGSAVGEQFRANLCLAQLAECK